MNCNFWKYLFGFWNTWLSWCIWLRRGWTRSILITFIFVKNFSLFSPFIFDLINLSLLSLFFLIFFLLFSSLFLYLSLSNWSWFNSFIHISSLFPFINNVIFFKFFPFLKFIIFNNHNYLDNIFILITFFNSSYNICIIFP